MFNEIDFCPKIELEYVEDRKKVAEVLEVERVSVLIRTQQSTENMIKFVLQSWGENQFLNLKKFLRLFVEKTAGRNLWVEPHVKAGWVTAVENYPLAVTKGQPTPQANKDGKKDKGWRDL